MKCKQITIYIDLISMDTYCWETNNLHVRWKRELGPTTIGTKRKIDYVLLLYIDA